MIIFLLCIFVLSLIVIETLALFGRTVRCHMAKVRSRIEHGEDPRGDLHRHTSVYNSLRSVDFVVFFL